jgi:fused signal recognition particle receptor
MFDALKKKFSSWLKPEEKPKKTAKAKSSKLTKTKETKRETKPTKKEPKAKRVKPSKEQLAEERKTTEKVMQDIKKEGIDTTAIDTKVQTAIDEIKQEDKEKKEQLDEESKESKDKKHWWQFGKEKTDNKTDKTQVETSENKEISKQEESFFSKLVKKLSTSALKEEDFDEAFQDLEITLLENNTSLGAVDKIRDSLKKALVDKEIKKDKIKDTIIQSLKDSILSVLIEPPNLLEQIKEHKNKGKDSKEPFTILFFGINGSGKTTSIAKLAHLLKKNNIASVLAAGDTFRAASIEQLETHSKAIGVPIIKSPYGSDPASVAFEAKKYAKQHNIQVVLIDTAGRMYTKSNLMKEMEKIVRVSQPDLKIFVGESITGNDATEQARMFNETAKIDGIILSKADIDEKAGTILSVSQVTGKPIYFLGTGQEYKDLTPFTKKEVLKNLGLE